jgi:hypothetical protein
MTLSVIVLFDVRYMRIVLLNALLSKTFGLLISTSEFFVFSFAAFTLLLNFVVLLLSGKLFKFAAQIRGFSSWNLFFG